MKQLPPNPKKVILIKGHQQVLNIFLIQNKGKGPPGRADSPERGLIPFPDYHSAVCKDNISNKSEINQINQHQFSIKFYN